MKSPLFPLAIAMLLAASAFASTAHGEALANVAAMKTVTAGAHNTSSGGFVAALANDENRCKMPDPNCYHSVTGDINERWWQVDLGAEFYVDRLEVWPRKGLWNGAADFAKYINGAVVRAYDDTMTEIGAAVTIAGVGKTDTPAVLTNGWNGVRYFKVVDEGGLAVSTATALELGEFLAYGSVATHPGYITGVTAAAPSSQDSDVDVAFMVNGEGMTDQTGLAGQMQLGCPDALARYVDAGMWQTVAGDPAPTITFDLGGSHVMDRMLIWNLNSTPPYAAGYPQGTDSGLNEIAVSTSTDGVAYTPLGNVTVAQAPGSDCGYQLDVDMTGITASHVRIDVLSNHGGAAYGLSEVRFYEVPEPGTGVLVAIGAIFFLQIARRRSQT